MAILEFLKGLQTSGMCAFSIPSDPTVAVWKGLSVVGDLPKELRECPIVKVSDCGLFVPC